MRLPSGKIIVFSDLHLGLWKNRNRTYSREQKAVAFGKLLEYGVRDGAICCLLNGDILDDRSTPESVASDSGLIRRSIGNFAGKIIYLRGNHDEDAAAARANDLLGTNVETVESEDFFLEGDGVLATHGHVLGFAHTAREFWKPLHGEFKEHLHRLLRRSKRRNQFVESYEDVSPAFRDFCERAALHFQGARERLAKTIERIPLLPRKADLAWMIAQGSIGEVAELSLLRNPNAWAAVVGHTHFASLHKRTVVDPGSRKASVICVGNTGSFVQAGAPFNAILVDTRDRNMRLLQFFNEDQSVRVVRQIRP